MIPDELLEIGMKVAKLVFKITIIVVLSSFIAFWITK